MTDAKSFWSYVHRDDEAEGGRITRLARDLAAQYELITSEPIQLFVDRDQIEWGDEWRTVVDEALASIAFFIPVLTPRYFVSEECRRELSSFARRATQLGVRELVMPILYVSSPSLEADPPPDELMVLAKTFQWENWTVLRFESLDSPDYRRAVAKMADRLARAALAVEQVEPPVPTISIDPEEEDDAPGFVDKVARAEEAMEEWVGTLEKIQKYIEEVGEITQAAGTRIQEADGRGGGMSSRLTIFRDLAREMDPVAEGIQDQSNIFVTQMMDVDAGIKVLVEQGFLEFSGTRDPDLLRSVQTFREQVDGLAVASREGLGALEQMVTAIAPVESQSRNLRPVLRKLRRGLSVMLDGRDVINSWVGQVDELLTRMTALGSSSADVGNLEADRSGESQE